MFWSKLITNQESDERLEQRIIWWWAPASSSVRAPRPLASTTANRPPLHMAPPAVLARRRSRRRHWGLPGQFSDFLFFYPFFPDERSERRTCSPDVQVGNGALCWCRGSCAVLGVQGWIQCSLLLLIWTQKHTRSEFRSGATELKLHQHALWGNNWRIISLSLSVCVCVCVCVKYSFRDNFIKSTENYVLQYTKEARTRLLFHRSSIRRFLPSQEEYFVPSETFPARRGFWLF